MTSKYKAQKTIVDGIVFDSKKEARRWHELKLLEKAGKIHMLQRQVKYILIPSQYEISDEVYKSGLRKGQHKKGKLIEKECSYVADFQYYDFDKKETIVEDTKGFKTKDYIIKRKLMLYSYGIQIAEV